MVIKLHKSCKETLLKELKSHKQEESDQRWRRGGVCWRGEDSVVVGSALFSSYLSGFPPSLSHSP